MKNNNPIGVFDSGVGGLSIWKELNELLPDESTIYLADTKYAPYGEKTKQEIIDLCVKNTDLLLVKGCKLIVVACNTATTNAISYLRANYSVPFIGIEPAIKPAALKTKTKKIGVLATKGTLSSALFHDTADLYADEIEIIEQKGTGLVSLIENGYLNSKETFELLQQYLNPMVSENIDYLVLGCTHYPFLIPQIRKIIPKDICIVDSGAAVALQVQRVLRELNLIESGIDSTHLFYNNVSVDVMQDILLNNYSISYLDF